VPVGGVSPGPNPMFMAARSAAALFAELNFWAQVAIARRVCGPYRPSTFVTPQP
jgi:hypothetical protein